MNYPKDLLYSKSHEWVKFSDESTALVGISDFAQDSLGDLVFINLPEVGDSVNIGESFGDAESVKAVSDLFSPVTGVVTAVNEEVLDNPAFVNSDPYGAWLIEVGQISEKEDLLSADAYEEECAKEA